MIDLTKDNNTVDQSDVIDVTMKEIGAVSENIDSSSFSIDDFNETIENIKHMNFVEINQFKNIIDGQISNIQGARTLIDAINGVTEYDETNKSIAINNILTQAEYKKNIMDFVDEYEITNTRLLAIKEECIARIKEYDEIIKNTSFLNNQMLESIDKRIAKIKEKEVLSLLDETSIAQLNDVRYVFEHRFDYSFIEKKSNLYYTLEGIKKDYRLKQKASLKKMVADCCKFFSRDQMLEVEKYIINIFNNDASAAHVFLIHMSRLLKNEKRNSDFNWIKVFIMNILDIHAEIFDNENEITIINDFIKSIYSRYKI